MSFRSGEGPWIFSGGIEGGHAAALRISESESIMEDDLFLRNVGGSLPSTPARLADGLGLKRLPYTLKGDAPH